MTNQKAVADHFGVTTRQVRNWLKDGAPRKSTNEYDLDEIDEWRLFNSAEDVDETGTNWGREQKKENVLRLRDERRKRNRELIELAEAERECVEMVTRFKRALLRLPKVCAPELEGHSQGEVTKILTAAACKKAAKSAAARKKLIARLVGLSRVDVVEILTRECRDTLDALGTGKAWTLSDTPTEKNSAPSGKVQSGRRRAKSTRTGSKKTSS